MSVPAVLLRVVLLWSCVEGEVALLSLGSWAVVVVAESVEGFGRRGLEGRMM